MAKYLISTCETYRVDSEKEAKELIEESKQNNMYVVNKYTCAHKERKSKGQIEDEWHHVTLTKVFNDEKDPEREITINYEE